MITKCDIGEGGQKISIFWVIHVLIGSLPKLGLFRFGSLNHRSERDDSYQKCF